jgi:hydrogenase expression/formation protein HypC
MCLGYPALVVEVDPDGATVEDRGRRRRASTLLLPDIEPGEWALVAAGSVIRRLDAADAIELAGEIARAEAFAGIPGPPRGVVS